MLFIVHVEGEWCTLFDGVCYLFPLVPALTVENIMVALRGIERRWSDIGRWLYVPDETRQEIRSQHSTDSDRLRAVILYALTLHPRSSWRCIIDALNGMEEHQVAERIQDYSETVTGMHIKDIIATIPCGVRLLSNECNLLDKLLGIMSCDNYYINYRT